MLDWGSSVTEWIALLMLIFPFEVASPSELYPQFISIT